MNINIDMAVIVAVGGFLISSIVMWKSNRNGFRAIRDESRSGFEKVDLKFTNLIQVLSLEREGMEKDICCIGEELKDLKIEVFPRLNNTERDLQKNCRALIDHKELCAERHKR